MFCFGTVKFWPLTAQQQHGSFPHFTSCVDFIEYSCTALNSVFAVRFAWLLLCVWQEYSKNPSQNWKNKDAAIYLVTSLAAKAQTQKVV